MHKSHQLTPEIKLSDNTKMVLADIQSAKVSEEEEEIPPFLQEIFVQTNDTKVLEDRGIILINDEISKESLAKASAKLWALHFDKSWNDTVQIIINSPGGYLDGCWAFIDTIDAIRLKVRTVAIGSIASAATLIFIAGDERVMAPNSEAMIHHFSLITAGSYPELLASRKQEDMQFKRMADHILRFSKYDTRKEITKHLLLEHDNWLSPAEMKSHGLCDIILRHRARKSSKKRSSKTKNAAKHTTSGSVPSSKRRRKITRRNSPK